MLNESQINSIVSHTLRIRALSIPRVVRDQDHLCTIPTTDEEYIRHLLSTGIYVTYAVCPASGSILLINRNRYITDLGDIVNKRLKEQYPEVGFIKPEAYDIEESIIDNLLSIQWVDGYLK